MPALLEAEDLVVKYGAATALDGVSIHVTRGEMVALVGANGAGKSTLINAVCGLIPTVGGSVRLAGRVAQVPEERQLFGDLSVEDNLRLGAWRGRHRDPTPVYTIFPKLRELRRRPAGTLSGGEQQMVAVGRALMAKPDLLAVDELSLGLAPRVVAELAAHLIQLNQTTGMAVLLVEQNARLAFDLCPRTYVLEAGRIVAEGPSNAIRTRADLLDAYLGAAT